MVTSDVFSAFLLVRQPGLFLPYKKFKKKYNFLQIKS